jgi:hypothetical protein
MLSPSTHKAKLDSPRVVPGRQHLGQIQLFVVGDLLDRIPRGDLPDQRKPERTVLIRDRDPLSDRQRASLVPLANERALFDERFDVLEHGDLADADLVGQFLHRRRIATTHARVADQLQNPELLGSQVHGFVG